MIRNEYTPIPLGGDYGKLTVYHFMRRLSNGTWADKPGSTESRFRGRIDIYSFSWDRGDTKGYYNSEIIFFKVSN